MGKLMNKKFYIASIIGIAAVAFVAAVVTGAFSQSTSNSHNDHKSLLTAGITSSSGSNSKYFGHGSPTGYCPYVGKTSVSCADRKPTPTTTLPLPANVCANSGLRLVYGGGGAGAGTSYYYMYVVNTSTTPCYLPSLPSVTIATNSGKTVSVAYQNDLSNSVQGGKVIIEPGNDPTSIDITSPTDCYANQSGIISLSFSGDQKTLSGPPIHFCSSPSPVANTNPSSSGVLNSGLTAIPTTTTFPPIRG